MDTHLSLAASIATGCIGGVFFAFSAIVMPALHRLPAPAAVAAMQSVNVAAVRPVFMLALFGTAALCVVVAVLGSGEAAPLRLAGAAAYLIGTIGVTIAGNVPLNNRLAALDAGASDAAAGWSGFSRPWTRLNTVRTLAALASAVLFGLVGR